MNSKLRKQFSSILKFEQSNLLDFSKLNCIYSSPYILERLAITVTDVFDFQ